MEGEEAYISKVSLIAINQINYTSEMKMTRRSSSCEGVERKEIRREFTR
jgi:hypothetical protein